MANKSIVLIDDCQEGTSTITVGELIERLQDFDENLSVFIGNENEKILKALKYTKIYESSMELSRLEMFEEAIQKMFEEEIAESVHLYNQYAEANNYELVDFFDSENYFDSMGFSCSELVRMTSGDDFNINDSYIKTDNYGYFVTSNDPYNDGWFDRPIAIAQWIIDNDIDIKGSCLESYVSEFEDFEEEDNIDTTRCFKLSTTDKPDLRDLNCGVALAIKTMFKEAVDVEYHYIEETETDETTIKCYDEQTAKEIEVLLEALKPYTKGEKSL